MADGALLVAVKQRGAFFGNANDIECTCRDGRPARMQEYSNQQDHNNQGRNNPEKTPISSTQHCHGQISFSPGGPIELRTTRADPHNKVVEYGRRPDGPRYFFSKFLM
jgi:hypothetical protein